MFQLYINIQTDFLCQIFLELFQLKTQSLFCIYIMSCILLQKLSGLLTREAKILYVDSSYMWQEKLWVRILTETLISDSGIDWKKDFYVYFSLFTEG